MTIDLSVLSGDAMRIMLLFARFGTLLMLMPAIGDTSIPPRIRLSLALLLTFVFYPLATAHYETLPGDQPILLILFFAGEMAIGFVVGFGVRLVTYAMQIAGMVIANQAGLSMALAADPTDNGQQGALIGAFLGVLAVTLVFASDSHHLLIAALNDSFHLFPPGQILPVDDIRIVMLETVAGLFSVAMRISAPFLMIGIVFYFGLGLLNRLMPQIQIFFIAMPFNIVLGIGLLMLVLGVMMNWYIEQFEYSVGRFLAG